MGCYNPIFRRATSTRVCTYPRYGALVGMRAGPKEGLCRGLREGRKDRESKEEVVIHPAGFA